MFLQQLKIYTYIYSISKLIVFVENTLKIILWHHFSGQHYSVQYNIVIHTRVRHIQ